MTTRYDGPGVKRVSKRSKRGKFRWGGMVPDGSPADLAPNEPRVLINVRREGLDFVARGGQEKLTAFNFGKLSSLFDARQGVMRRVYFHNGATIGGLGWFDHNVSNEWALHHQPEASPDLPPDVYNDQLAVMTGVNANTLLGIVGLPGTGSGVALIPLSQMFPFHVFPFPTTGVTTPPTSGIPFFGSPPSGIIAPYLPIVAYDSVAFPQQHVMGARVFSTYLFIFVRRVLDGAGNFDVVMDPFDGSKLQSRETIVVSSALTPSLCFVEPWRPDRLILAFRDPSNAAVQKIFVRAAGTPPQTWTAVAPSAGVLTAASGGASFKGDFYVFGYNGGTAPANSGAVWQYNGSTLALIHTIANCQHNFDGVVVGTDEKVYFAYYRNDGGGLFSVRLASFDGSTWNDSAVNISAQFGSEPPDLVGVQFRLPFIAHAGGAFLVGRGGPNSAARGYFTVTTNLAGTWRRTNYSSDTGTAMMTPVRCRSL